MEINVNFIQNMKKIKNFIDITQKKRKLANLYFSDCCSVAQR